MKEGTTSALLRRLFHSTDLENFMECHADDMEVPTFHAYITERCKESGLVPEQVIKHSGIERTYGHQLFNGTRKPSRDKVIQIAFGFGMDLDETQRLLQVAQKSPLYPKIKRDAAIIFCINHQKDIWETQSALDSLGLTLLGGE
jgi:transcriptional regulator with XRE-family HTH domain